MRRSRRPHLRYTGAAGERRRARQTAHGALRVRTRARDAEGVTASASEIGTCALELAQLRARLGVPESDGAALLPEVDPLAAAVAGVYVRSLPEAPEVSRATGVTPDQLAALLGQHTEMVRLFETVEQLGGDLGDSRALVGLVQGRAVRRVVRKVRALLGDDSVPLDVREKLRSDAAELLRLADAERDQRRARRRRTLEQKRATAAQLDAQARRRRLLETMIALRKGQEVPADELAEAMEAYGELLAERRDPTR